MNHFVQTYFGLLLHFINILLFWIKNPGYLLSPSDFTNTNRKIMAYHRIAEAFKFAYAKRSELGDEDFVEGIQQVSYYNLLNLLMMF